MPRRVSLARRLLFSRLAPVLGNLWTSRACVPVRYGTAGRPERRYSWRNPA